MTSVDQGVHRLKVGVETEVEDHLDQEGEGLKEAEREDGETHLKTDRKKVTG
jgi:hypothetical protein